METEPPLAPLTGDQTADVVIVGAGFTGLASAYYLAEAFPDSRILLIEGARVGYAASGRNDGLLLPWISGAEELAAGLIAEGRVADARAVYEKSSEGIDIVEALVTRHGVECEWERRDCIRGALTNTQMRHLERMHRNEELIGLNPEWLTPDALRQRLHVPGYRAASTVRVGGMLNPAKLARGMLALVRARGVEVYEQSPAVKITPGPTHTVRTPAGTIRASALVLATNAYTGRLGFFPRRILPIHSYSLASAPLSDEQIAALCWQGRNPFLDVRNFFEVFRLTADNRIVFSGGDARYYYGAALVDDQADRAYSRLEGAFRRRFPDLADVPVTHRWVGHVGLALDMVPTIGVTGAAKNLYFAVGYSGHGVGVTFLAGRLIRDLYAGTPIDPALDFVLNHRPLPAGVEPFTSLGFALYRRYLHWRDTR
jgi:glycine/D-amino acid oxidase-like deaminating enzyme